MKDSRCPKCGATLHASMAQGLCPQCLMEMNLAGQTEFTQQGPDSFADSRDPQPETEPQSVEAISRLFPAFEVIEILGRGGMGVVYKARQRSLDRFVALKILAPERVCDDQFAERFTREAKILASLNHENIVTVYDFGEVDGKYYLTMELVDGVNLRELLRQGRMTPERALAIVPSVCQALSFAHDKGVVHRDIKPENLLVDQQGRVKIADFGIAKLLAGKTDSSASGRGGETATGLTNHGRLGTPSYMAPEQENRPGLVDHRADIFSLGVVFYEMLTGELPDKKLEPPSQKVTIDLRLDEVVLRAMERQPERRYQTATELRTEVESVRQNETRDAAPTWRTWAPGRSRLARQVCARMSAEEKREMWRSDCRDGMFFAIPLVALYIGYDLLSPETDLLIVVALMALLLVSFIPWLIRRDRQFLAGTQWARKQGIQPADLRRTAREMGRFERCLESVSRWRKPLAIGLLVVGLGLSFLLLWLERPQRLGQTVSVESADRMIVAEAQTWHRMRMFGGDELYYRFRIQGFAGSMSESWELPVPYGRLAKDFVLMSTESLRFDQHGQIIWSDDQQRVAFLVNEIEVDAFNTTDRSHSFQGGFQPQLVVALGQDDDSAGVYLDLDSGNVHSDRPLGAAARRSSQREVKQIHQLESFMRESGADVVFRPGIGLTLLDGLSLGIEKSGPMGEPRAFDLTSSIDVKQGAAELERIRSVAREQSSVGAEPLIASLSPGNVWIFLTRDEGVGLLEVLEDSPNGEGTRLRYKLLAK